MYRLPFKKRYLQQLNSGLKINNQAASITIGGNSRNCSLSNPSDNQHFDRKSSAILSDRSSFVNNINVRPTESSSNQKHASDPNQTKMNNLVLLNPEYQDQCLDLSLKNKQDISVEAGRETIAQRVDVNVANQSMVSTGFPCKINCHFILNRHEASTAHSDYRLNHIPEDKNRYIERRNMMKLICRVCDCVKSRHKNYGAEVCQACRAFFKRSIKRGQEYICTSESNLCFIKGTLRNDCRACRFKSCIDAGMKYPRNKSIGPTNRIPQIENIVKLRPLASTNHQPLLPTLHYRPKQK